MEAHITINPAEFQRFKDEVGNHPITMLNLLKYKEQVKETGETGKVAYGKYMNAAAPFLKSVGAEVLFFGAPKHMVIGPSDEELWDAVLLVRYNSFTDFMSMVKAEGYPAHLRDRALRDSRLIHCKSIQ